MTEERRQRLERRQTGDADTKHPVSGLRSISARWEHNDTLLEEIREILPKSVWLTSVGWSGPSNVSFTGYAMSYDDMYAAYGEAYKFRRTLLNSPNFTSVKVKFVRSTTIAVRDVVQFEFQCGVKLGKIGEEEAT